MFRFRCNVCGSNCSVEKDKRFLRDEPTCNACGSSVRFRWIIHALSTELFGKSLTLPEFPRSKEVKGIGLTDSAVISLPLARKLGYTNTFYHQNPRVDILNRNSDRAEANDFVIASEVFEHLPPPVQRGFDSLVHLLRPNGFVIFSCPWDADGHTREYYPDLYDWRIVELKGGSVLVNRTADGKLQTFDNLVFHGGSGDTLEMRLFSRSDLIAHFQAAGFEEIEVAEIEVNPDYGIVWEPWSRGMIARKVATRSRNA